MSETHTPRERAELYRKGWQRGAGAKIVPEHLRDDSDFNDGYGDGCQALAEAMAKARKRLGAPPPSILRSQDVEPRDVAHMQLTMVVGGETYERSYMFDEVSMLITPKLGETRVDFRGTQHHPVAVLQQDLTCAHP